MTTAMVWTNATGTDNSIETAKGNYMGNQRGRRKADAIDVDEGGLRPVRF